MHAISASIIVLSGSIIFAAGGLISHNDTQVFFCFVGAVLGLSGLWGWALQVAPSTSKALIDYIRNAFGSNGPRAEPPRENRPPEKPDA